MLPRALADHLPWALGLRSWCGHLSCPEPEAELTICLRSAIREGLEALRSSLLGVSSAGSGVRSASSPRSAVCKADSTSSDLTASTGDSHTTWIVRPGDKTVGGKPSPDMFYTVGPACPLTHTLAAVWSLEPFLHGHVVRKQPATARARQRHGFRRGKRPAR